MSLFRVPQIWRSSDPDYKLSRGAVRSLRPFLLSTATPAHPPRVRSTSLEHHVSLSTVPDLFLLSPVDDDFLDC